MVRAKDPRCIGCKYNVPKTLGGKGIICNQRTMVDHNRCPEWVINDARNRLRPGLVVK